MAACCSWFIGIAWPCGIGAGAGWAAATAAAAIKVIMINSPEFE
jgi:hypothetical protein